MKICFLGLDNLPALAREYNHHGIGGAQLQMTLIAKALRRKGNEISMVVADYGQQDGEAWDGITTYKAYKQKAGLPVLRFIHPRWSGIWTALQRAQADVYFTSCAGMQVGLLAMYCNYHSKGLIFRLAHDGDASPSEVLIRLWRDKKLYEFGLRRANAVLCQNMTQMAGLLQHYGIQGNLIKSLVEVPEKELDLLSRDIPILWVNNIRDIKRPDLALELAARMPDRFYHMVGGPQPGFAGMYADTQVRATRLPNLSFYGHVPYHDVGDFYDRARVFVNTSDSEGFPNSYLQSWRRGVPVVAFFDPDGLIRREGLGYAVNGMDEMRQAVEKLLSDDSEWQRVSARCRAYMERHHGDDVVLEPYLTAIEQAYTARRPA